MHVKPLAQSLASSNTVNGQCYFCHCSCDGWLVLSLKRLAAQRGDTEHPSMLISGWLTVKWSQHTNLHSFQTLLRSCSLSTMKGTELTPLAMHPLDPSWNSHSLIAQLSGPSKANVPILLSGFCFHAYEIGAYEMVLAMHIALGDGGD